MKVETSHIRARNNERKWFITPQSVALAIEEERGKQANPATPPPAEKATGDHDQPSERFREVPQNSFQRTDAAKAEIDEAHLKIRDLEIASRVKDLQIKYLQDDRAKLQHDHSRLYERLITAGQRIGHLQSRLLIAAEGGVSPNTANLSADTSFMLGESPETDAAKHPESSDDSGQSELI